MFESLIHRFKTMIWCRCNGQGFWLEQIHGNKMRRVTCKVHWYLDKTYEYE